MSSSSLDIGNQINNKKKYYGGFFATSTHKMSIIKVPKQTFPCDMSTKKKIICCFWMEIIIKNETVR